MQMVYGGCVNGVRWWRVQEAYGSDVEPMVFGQVSEPNFDFFPANEVRLSRWELLEIYGFCEELENRFKAKSKSENPKQNREAKATEREYAREHKSL